MNESSQYVAGIDVGTTAVRCVVASLNSDNKPTIVGVGKVENNGMKKGVVSHLSGPAKAIDEALGEAERMSGFQIDQAALSINGSHIISTKSDGMVAVTSANREVSDDDLRRIEEVATIGKIPANREILNFIPYSYSLDGQDGISNPLDMVGTRLEVKANVVSAMTPYVNNLHQVAEHANVKIAHTTPSVLAAAEAVLNEKQRENGVAVIDLGASTTGVAIFEEGDLQFLRVIPLGGNNITNDLAIGLKVTPEVAEEVKLKHGVAVGNGEAREVMVKHGREHYSFNTEIIDDIIDARLEEIFDEIRKVFKKAGCDKQLPNGIVLVGGGANLKKIAEYSKKNLELASQIGEIEVESTISDDIKAPEFAAAVGLMLENSRSHDLEPTRERHGDGFSFFKKLFNKNK